MYNNVGDIVNSNNYFNQLLLTWNYLPQVYCAHNYQSQIPYSQNGQCNQELITHVYNNKYLCNSTNNQNNQVDQTEASSQSRDNPAPTINKKFTKKRTSHQVGEIELAINFTLIIIFSVQM